MRSLHVMTMTFGILTGAATSTPATTNQGMIVTAFEEAAFSPVNPDLPDGPQIAVLWGDPSSGPSAMLMKLKKGSVPLHTHSSDYHLVVLQGVMKHWGHEQTEALAKQLGPGSYWFQPGEEIHADSCLTDECLLHIVWAGRRDARLAAPQAP